jgi:hypothetical protein
MGISESPGSRTEYLRLWRSGVFPCLPWLEAFQNLGRIFLMYPSDMAAPDVTPRKALSAQRTGVWKYPRI